MRVDIFIGISIVTFIAAYFYFGWNEGASYQEVVRMLVYIGFLTVLMAYSNKVESDYGDKSKTPLVRRKGER